MVSLDLRKSPGHQIESFVPSRLPELVTFADQRLGESFGAINKVPTKLSFWKDKWQMTDDKF